MTNIIKKETDILVNKITSKFKVQKIILFGSYAEGNSTEESDIDLCIISNDIKNNLDLSTEIRMELSSSEYPIDILVYKPEQFDYRADSKTSMESQIKKYGVVLYE